MNSYQKSLNFCKLPLAFAISSLILVGCSNTSSTTTPQVATIPQSNSPQLKGVSTVPAGDNSLSMSILDDESLEELADLLEATDMAMVEDDKLAIQHYGNLWDRLRAGFLINQNNYQNNPRIEAQKSWFTSRQDYINRLTARASRYLYHTVSEAERRNIPTELALLPVIESSYDPSATSNANAAGLWQFIPSTGRIYGLTQTPTYDGRRDVIESTRAAYDFLTALYNQFGSWELALAAYNAGPGRVQRAIDANISQGLPTDFWSLNLPEETKNYVPRFLAVAQIVSDSSSYNMRFPAIANRQHFRSVPVNYGVTLNEVAQYTNISSDELRMLNPSLIDGRVDTAGPSRLIIPNSVNLTADAKLSQIAGNGIYLPNVPDSQYEQLAKSPEGLAEFASKARVPLQNNEYIAPNPSPNNPSVNVSNINAIETELKQANTLPTTSARITNYATITQEPPLTDAEKRFIADQIRSQTPDVGEVVSSVDGNVKLQAIQTQQSVLNSKGVEKRLRFLNSAQPKVSSPTGQRTVYTVQRGDTLSSIASKSGLNWRDIANWNQINASDNLLAGSKLYLYDARPINPATVPVTPQSSINNQKFYTVQNGDTLIGTANRLGLSVSQLASYNNLSTNADLQLGQKLWTVPNKIAPNATIPKRSSSNNQAISTQSNYQGVTTGYKVQSGDTLIGISKKLGVPHTTIAQINNIESNTRLQRGQTIQVPANNQQVSLLLQDKSVSYKVTSGDTLTGVAKKFKVSLNDLASANGLSTNSQLQRGTTITIPSGSGSSTVQSAPSKAASTTSSQASVTKNTNPETVRVTSGDSLIGLANKYGVSVSNFAAANNLSTTAQLQIGQRLTIPNGNNESSVQPKSTESKSASPSTFTGSYTVKSGDSLIGLSNKLGVSVTDLAAANNLNTNAQLQINQKIKVPVNSPSKVSSPTTQTVKSASVSGNYTVKSGDSLIRLAANNGLSVQQLAKANGLASNAELKIGQKIVIPATTTTYKVKSGDTLIGLAKKHGMTPAQLAVLNNIESDAMLQRGQTLKLPLN